MSQQVERFGPNKDRTANWGSMIRYPNGDFVFFCDYASLAAEYVELKDLYLKCRIDIGNLHKENERLRKAGDAMAERIDADGQPHLETDDWDAAKEGGRK